MQYIKSRKAIGRNITIALLLAAWIYSPLYAEDDKPKAQGLDMVSDTVSTAFDKANALLAGKLEFTMSKDEPRNEDAFTRNAIGQKVPKATAVKSAGSLHNDQPL